MKMLGFAGALAAALLMSGLACSAAAVKSGPQVDDEVPGPFHPLNVNGEFAGEKNCLYCEFGSKPVAMVFARELTPSVADLIKKLDAATAKNSDDDLCTCVIFTTSDKGMYKKLDKLVKEAGIKKTVLAVDDADGPEDYKLSKDADLTVLLYNKHNVKANLAFGKADVNDKAVDKVVGSLSVILPKK
jgi:hypothetical protein